MELSVVLVDDDKYFSWCVWVGMSEWIKQLWKDAKFTHIDPEDRYDPKHGIDFMYPRFLDIIRKAKEEANSVIILSDATFMSNLSDELQEATLPQKRELFSEQHQDIKLWILSWTSPDFAEYELWREYMDRLKFIRRETRLYIPWITKPVIINDILEWVPWDQTSSIKRY